MHTRLLSRARKRPSLVHPVLARTALGGVVLAVAASTVGAPTVAATTTYVAAESATLPAGEASGMVASKQYPGVLWWHRDGGTATAEKPRDAVFAVKLDSSGNPQPVRGTERYPFWKVNAKNTNWEDIALDNAGNLWIGDIGANNCGRTNQTLLKVKEPSPTSTTGLTVAAKYTFRFPDPAAGCATWNSEAMFWLDGKLYIFAKNSTSSVYRIDLPTSGTTGTAKLTRIGQLAGGVGNISVSSVSADKSRLMVATHRRTWIYKSSNPSLTGDAFVKDIVSRTPAITATFSCGASTPNVEGGAYRSAGRDLAWVSEGKNIFSATASQVGDTAS